MDLNINQLMLLRSLQRGFETGFIPIFLRRCSATEEDWKQLVDAGYIEKSKDGWRVGLSESGKKAYKKGKIGRYF
jgi:hypothetical protein